jgi:hypothetical protein
MKQGLAMLGVFFVIVAFIGGVYIGGLSKQGTASQSGTSDTGAADIEIVVPKGAPETIGEQPAAASFEVSGEYSFSDMSGFERFFTQKGPFGAPAVIVETPRGDYQVPDGTMSNFSLHSDTVGTMGPFGDSCTLVVEVTYALSNPVRTGKKDSAGNEIVEAQFDHVVKKGNAYDSCWSESGTPTRTQRKDTFNALQKSAQTIASVKLAPGSKSVSVTMKDGTTKTVTLADMPLHDMGNTPAGEDGAWIPTTCAPQGIYDAQLSDFFPGKVLLTTSSGACAFDSDFTETVVYDPRTKGHSILPGKHLAVSHDGACALQAVGDGNRGASPIIVVVHPYTGAVSGKFDTFFMGSPLQQSFVELTKQAGALQTLEGTQDSNWFTVDGFEQGSCRVVFSTRNPKLYGGIWTFSVNVWGKNPKLIQKP